MCPPDPRRDAAERAAEASSSEGDVETLRADGDVDGLLALARACRARRAMKECYEAYAAAAELGSGDGEYAAALFELSGGVVPQDLKAGVTRLRAAAEKGSLPARVYLGNLYEQGIHYKADPEKADVWYRNAARAAGIEGAPGSDAWTRALAELGCVRYVLARTQKEGADCEEEEKARLLAKAKAHGYGLRIHKADEGERMTLTAALVEAEAAPPSEKPKAASEPARTNEGNDSRVAQGLSAFGYALLFAATGAAAAYAAAIGASALVASGRPLPIFGGRVELVFPAVLLVFGVLPSTLVYRWGTIAKAAFAAAAFGGVGFIAWGTGQGVMTPNRVTQAIAFALAGFLASLLVLGLLGGTKRRRTRLQRRR